MTGTMPAVSPADTASGGVWGDAARPGGGISVEDHAYNAWSVAPHYLEHMTAELARDLIIECLAVAHRHNFEARSGVTAGSMDARTLHDIASTIVRTAFSDLGYDFNEPDAASCRMVVEHLSRESHLRGTPATIIDHHICEYRKVLAALESA